MNNPAFFQTDYDRAACQIGIVHIGYGAFHRAHQAVYLDDYMQTTGDLRWGIAAVNLRPSEAESFTQSAQARQGYLLKSIAPDRGVEFRKVRSHVAFVDASAELEAAIALFALPSVTVASMTVTESGYSFTEDWDLDLTAPAVAADLTGAVPQTVYGFLAKALDHRRVTTAAPLTLLCCDNIRNNGAVLRGALMTFLRAAGADDLANWVEGNVSFPCSMVDRITPRATDALRDEVAALFPAHADTAIHAESFVQWVLEDRFAADMPDLARAGVQLVQDVEPYEETKIRILNGGHTGLCYLGALAGHQTFDAAMTDPALRAHFDAWEDEVLAGLPPSIPFDTRAYLDQVAARFENAGIADQVERICMDGYSKMAIYMRPTLAACLAQGRTPRAGYDCVASWIVYARQHQRGQARIPYHEPLWDRVAPLLAPGDEARVAQDTQLWGDLPSTYPQFGPDLIRAIQEMDKRWQA